MRQSRYVLATVGAVMSASALMAQMGLGAMDSFALQQDGLAIRRHVEAGKPFTVAGERGVLLGQQEGTFEAWVLPVKMLSHFAITANVEGYSVPIDLNAAAAEIEVFPDHTTITYAHIAFTVRQIMFAPDSAPDGTGAVALFQIDAIRPMDLTFSFTPEMRSMWPQPDQGVPSAEWVTQGGSGFYVLHTDFPNLAGAVAMPGARSGIMAPYQEKPQVHPLELKLHYDPKRDGGRFFPLLLAMGRTPETATNAALQAKLAELHAGMPGAYAAHAARYARMAAELTTIETPDASLNDDLRWAEISIEQLKARAQPSGEIGLVAGYYSSGDSARPGFGWFFGRDSLYTLYAVNSFGDFGLTRAELDFIIKRQRADGKIMHEYSQTAAFVDWAAFPYLYAAADATPLFLTQMLDYVRASGDVEYLRRNRAAVEKAWQFETARTSDTDGDGIYDNSQGTGWVESWPTARMPHQEIYLALFDQQASAAMAELARLLGDDGTAASAKARATSVAAKIEAEYYEPAKRTYAFSRNADGSLDRTATIYPAVAWWNVQPGGGSGLAHPEDSLRQWASHEISTDWGARDVAESEPFYDPISYHQGSVWPLFTGWAAMAEYRSGHPLAGYAHLMQTAGLTTAQDLGAVTELLSGAYFEPFGRSTSHQLWSSAMVIIPALRGLFGIDLDATASTIHLSPSLPADWDMATVRQLHVGESVCDLTYTRTGAALVVRSHTVSGKPLKLVSEMPGARVAADGASITFALPAVEVVLPYGLPLPGARTAQMKVLNETRTAHSLTLELEGMAGSAYDLKLHRNATGLPLEADGGTIVPAADTLHIAFPAGSGYQARVVTLRW